MPCVRHLAVLTAQHLACFSYAFVEAPYAASLISFSRTRAWRHAASCIGVTERGKGTRGEQLRGDIASKRARAHQKAAASMDLLLPAWSGCMQNTREVTSSYVVVGSWFSLFPSFTYLTSRQNITGSAPRANSFHPPTPRLSPSFS